MADSKLKFPEDPAYATGRAARERANAYGQAQRDVVSSATRAFARPLVSATNAAVPYVRGFFGVEPESASPAARTERPAAASAPPAAAAPPRATSPAAPPAAAKPKKPTLLAPVTVQSPIRTGAHGENVYNNETLARLGMTPAGDAAAAGRASAPPQPLPRLQAATQPVVARPSTAPEVQDATQRALQQTQSETNRYRDMQLSDLDPRSNGSELMRRLEISQGYGANKGSPQARRMIGEALLGQINARAAAPGAGQQSAHALLQQGAQGEALAAESAAQRRLDADQGNQTAQQVDAQRVAEGRRPAETIRDVSGRTSVLRNDGTVSTLRDEEGAAIRTPAPADTARLNIVSADTQYKSLAERLAAIQQFGRPNDPQAAAEYDRTVSAIQAQMDQLAGQQSRTAQPPPEAIAELRANPEAAAQFDEIFGAGAAATYLTR